MGMAYKRNLYDPTLSGNVKGKVPAGRDESESDEYSFHPDGHHINEAVEVPAYTGLVYS